MTDGAAVSLSSRSTGDQLAALLTLWQSANDSFDALDQLAQRVAPFLVREWIQRTIQTLEHQLTHAA